MGTNFSKINHFRAKFVRLHIKAMFWVKYQHPLSKTTEGDLDLVRKTKGNTSRKNEAIKLTRSMTYLHLKQEK